MNNSQIVLETVELPNEELVAKRAEREGQLVRIIEAIREVKKSNAWSTLKSEIFDNLAGILQRDLLSEAKKDTPDPLRLNRIAGQLKWAEKYANLDKMEEDYKTQLSGLRKQTHG